LQFAADYSPEQISGQEKREQNCSHSQQQIKTQTAAARPTHGALLPAFSLALAPTS